MRLINVLYWHCTATPEGREVSIIEVDAWHKARGWAGFGYHNLVHLDGSVSQGRPASRIGAHVGGHNADSLGYCYVGGLDRDMRPKDTRTAAQKATMLRLTVEAIKAHALRSVLGHHDTDAGKACPCFPARVEYAHLLGQTAPAPAGPIVWPDAAMGMGTATAVSGLRFRDAPDGAQTGSVPFGTRLKVYGHDGDWLQVETPGGYRGFVSDRWVILENSSPEEVTPAPAPEAGQKPAKTDFHEEVDAIIAAAERIRERAAA